MTDLLVTDLVNQAADSLAAEKPSRCRLRNRILLPSVKISITAGVHAWIYTVTLE